MYGTRNRRRLIPSIDEFLKISKTSNLDYNATASACLQSMYSLSLLVDANALHISVIKTKWKRIFNRVNINKQKKRPNDILHAGFCCCCCCTTLSCAHLICILAWKTSFTHILVTTIAMQKVTSTASSSPSYFSFVCAYYFFTYCCSFVFHLVAAAAAAAVCARCHSCINFFTKAAMKRNATYHRLHSVKWHF